MSHHLLVRPAEAQDVEYILSLLQPYVDRHIILPRTADDIFQSLQEFMVAEYDSRLAGAVAMHVYGSNLGEIRSLVVSDDFQGHGIGRLLVEACETVAIRLGLVKLFALTYVPDFFTSMAYAVVPKESLPQKVWTVCVHCARFVQCEEVAVQKQLADAPISPMQLPPIIETSQE
jgi:amino-acid N-acetyltransferase